MSKDDVCYAIKGDHTEEEVMKRLGVRELREHIDEVLRMVEEEGEIIEITKGGKIVAFLVPASEPQLPVQQELTPFWQKMEQLATEIGKHLPEKVDAVEIVRDLRREL